MTPTTTGTDSTLTSSPLPNSPDADTTTNNYSNPRTQFQSVDEKKRNRHHRNNRRPRRKRSTLSATREQRNVHKKAPDYFDVEATLHEGSVAIIRLSHTPTGWKDSIMSVVEISPTFEIKQDLYPLVANEYIFAETPQQIIEWMETDFSSVRLLA